MITATIWINGDTCRCIVKDNATVIDLDDSWNNRASAEMSIQRTYPAAVVKFIDGPRTKDLNREWTSCRIGN